MKTVILIVTVLITLQMYAQKSPKQEKDKIYLTIKTFDDWYKEGFISYEDFTQTWYIKGNKATEINKRYSGDDFNKYVIERITAIDTLKILTDNYYDILLKRLNREGKFNEAMVLINHNFGNMINSFLVKRIFMDGIPAYWPEENIFVTTNENMSDSEYAAWHKERIQILDSDNAIYKLFYGEIGYSQDSNPSGQGDIQLFLIYFVKEDNFWKINDIVIQEQSEKEAKEFYKENVERRGYFVRRIQ